MKRFTIVEIAKLAGVSTTTVSKVFNDKTVSKKTKDKVLEVAKKLNYQPSTIAQSLRNKKSKAISLMLPNITNPLFPEIIKGVEEVALENDYVVIVCSFEDELRKERHYFQLLDNRWIDGIILSGITGDKEENKYIQNTQERGIPVVFIDRGIEGRFLDLVGIDNQEATFEATKYLLELEHKRVGFVNGLRKIKLFAKRLEGYKRALGESGLEFDENLVVEGERVSETAESAINQFLSQKKHPTAIFAMGDLLAITILRGIQMHGLKIPEDVSIIGFDNIPLASLTNPSLTTVNQPAYEMGRQAMKLLIDRIEGKDSIKRKIILDTELVIRESTARVKKNLTNETG